MTSTIRVTAHAPNGDGVDVTIYGNGTNKTEFVKNGETQEFVIFDDLRFRATERISANSDTAREGSVTARLFNPSGHPVVEGVKDRVEELAAYISGAVPKCRRRSVALTNLETASMYAVKANFYTDD